MVHIGWTRHHTGASWYNLLDDLGASPIQFEFPSGVLDGFYDLFQGKVSFLDATVFDFPIE